MRVAGLDRAHVHLLELEVAAGLDADQVRVRAVGAADVAADRWIAASFTTGTSAPTGPMKPAGPIRSPISSARRLAEALAERVGELDLVQAMVAADEHHDHAALLGDDRYGFEQGAGGHAERARDVRRPSSCPGVGTSRGSSSSGGISTGCGSALATSTFAA